MTKGKASKQVWKNNNNNNNNEEEKLVEHNSASFARTIIIKITRFQVYRGRKFLSKLHRDSPSEMDVINYSTILDKFHFQGHFKVMANFDLDDVMTLKPSIF